MSPPVLHWAGVLCTLWGAEGKENKYSCKAKLVFQIVQLVTCIFQTQNLEEYNEQYILWEIQKLEVLAITNIVNYSSWDTRQITAPFGFQTSGF